MRTKISLSRVAGVIGLSLGAAVMSGCANWGDDSRMGAGPAERATKRGAYGPGTVMPSGTTGPVGTPGVGGTPGAAPGSGAATGGGAATGTR